MLRKLIQVLLIILIISSCSTLKHSDLVDNQVALTNNNLDLLNGCYNRFPNDSLHGDARDLFGMLSLKNHDFKYKGKYVKLTVIDEKHIKFDLVNNDSITYTKTLKGKLKNNEFVFNRQMKIIPVIVATIYMDSKVRIGILDTGDLIVDAKHLEYGLTYFVLPLGGGDKKYDQKFERNTKNSNLIID